MFLVEMWQANIIPSLSVSGIKHIKILDHVHRFVQSIRFLREQSEIVKTFSDIVTNRLLENTDGAGYALFWPIPLLAKSFLDSSFGQFSFIGQFSNVGVDL